MIPLREVESRLAHTGFHNRFWGRAEVKELPNILMPDEQINRAVNGFYESGLAMLVATDRRLLLIDKKPLFMTMEDIRYDMISEVNYFSNVFDAGVAIKTINTTLVFKSWRQKVLRNLCNDVQQRVMELRQNHLEAEARLAEELNQRQTQSVPLQPTAYQPASNQPSAAYPFQAVTNPDKQPFLLSRKPGYPSVPLTVRRRTGRFYPNTGQSIY